MRLLLFAVCLSTLGAGSYAALTHEWRPTDAAEPSATEPLPGPSPAGPASGALAPPSGSPRLPATASAASRRAPAPPPAPTGRPAVRTRVTTETYAVDGQTRDEVLASMLAAGPRADGDVFFGLTVAEIGLRYEATADAAGCALTDVEVDLALTITLPDWAPRAPADPPLARDWGRFRRALAAHEDRHREIAETGAASIAQALGGLRRASCPATEAEARRRLTRLEGAVAAAQHRYDAETDHGRTEGAVWTH